MTGRQLNWSVILKQSDATYGLNRMEGPDTTCTEGAEAPIGDHLSTVDGSNHLKGIPQNIQRIAVCCCTPLVFAEPLVVFGHETTRQNFPEVRGRPANGKPAGFGFKSNVAIPITAAATAISRLHTDVRCYSWCSAEAARWMLKVRVIMQKAVSARPVSGESAAADRRPNWSGP